MPSGQSPPSSCADAMNTSVSLRRHMVFALVAIAVVAGGLTGAASLVEISGAVIAPGSIVVETSTKRVQHRDGGIVKDIFVREGDTVEAGELLVRLDDTIARANLTIVTTRLQELLAQEARLVAERDGQSEFTKPSLLKDELAGPKAEAVLDGQKSLMEARRQSRQGREAQLTEQIKQFEQQIDGLSAQRSAKGEEIRLVGEELEDLSTLIEKGLIQQSRITALKRDKARLQGEYGGLASQIAQASQSIAERKIQILQIAEEMRAEVVEQLPVVRGEIAQMLEQRVTTLEQLRRLEIRAPRAGFVHQLSVHTVGGVVAPGEDLMLIVPQEDLLIVEAQVAPTDIDQLAPDQVAVVRFPGLDQRSTPELHATVLTVSADLMQDPNNGVTYYRARLTLPDSEIARLGDKRLVPGMPVEAFVQTGSRTILSYLLKPLADNIAHVFREG